MNIEGYSPVGTIVLGAGLVGTATAVACAERNHAQDKDKNKRTLIIEKGDPHTYRDCTPSQGDLRGSRAAEHTMEITGDIRTTTKFSEQLEKEQGITIANPASNQAPYLMVVKEKQHVDGILWDLAKKKSPCHYYSIQAATQEFGLGFPNNYKGVINALESRTLNIDAYFKAMNTKLEALNGSVQHDTTIIDYAKLNDGKHAITLSDGSRYIADEFIVATGLDISDTLHNLKELHDSHADTEPGSDVAPKKEVPPRFAKEHCITVPQRTIHVVFKDGIVHPKPTTVYMLDVAREIDTGNGETQKTLGDLGFYMFPDTITLPDGTKKLGLKIGYDPMSCSATDQAMLNKQLAKQQNLMLEHVAKMYGVKRNDMEIIRTHTCAYGIDVIHHPCMGKSDFHDIGVASNFIGYGAMAAYGAAKRMVGNTINEKSRYMPDMAPSVADKAIFTHMYGPDKNFPTPPSSLATYSQPSHNSNRSAP